MNYKKHHIYTMVLQCHRFGCNAGEELIIIVIVIILTIVSENFLENSYFTRGLPLGF